jgi:magnesium chelatase subunit D
MPLTFSAAYEAPVNPYPEDTAPVEREAASLKLPTRRFRSKTIARGPIIGVEKATSLQDIALVRTLLEAAKFQSIRQKSVENSNNGLILSPKDLHSYRRAPVAEQMLMLVLDHTCLEDCKWQDALLPYLSWAYVERASICLIQVGAADACHELQAEKVMAQSILTPRISAGIEAKGGKATPLAHGLDLALQTLRHALQHGRSTVQQVVLVAISDGRGNVPLAASRSNRKPQSVKRQGIEDALNIAKSIASLDNVQPVLLNPQSKAYPELPLELAKALGAKVVLIPLQETWELEP